MAIGIYLFGKKAYRSVRRRLAAAAWCGFMTTPPTITRDSASQPAPQLPSVFLCLLPE